MELIVNHLDFGQPVRSDGSSGWDRWATGRYKRWEWDRHVAESLWEEMGWWNREEPNIQKRWARKIKMTSYSPHLLELTLGFGAPPRPVLLFKRGQVPFPSQRIEIGYPQRCPDVSNFPGVAQTTLPPLDSPKIEKFLLPRHIGEVDRGNIIKKIYGWSGHQTSL